MTTATILTILVVEDEPLIRMYGVDILEDAGFAVIEAGDADEALDILSAGAPVQLIFSDVDMPGSMDGLEFAWAVHRRWPCIHLLLTSGHHRLEKAQLPEAGLFLPKPWTSESLADVMRDFAGQ